MLKWIIEKGQHYSSSNFWERLRLKIGTGKTSYKFNLSPDCWFPYADPDDYDINKLLGFSFGYHHCNSVRVGWVPNFKKEGTITLYLYLYNQGKRLMFKFEDVVCGKDYQVEISFNKENKDHQYVSFQLSDSTGQIKKQSAEFKLPFFRIGYYLWFYFGGNKTAPKKMEALIG